MKKYQQWYTYFLFAILAFSLQSCLGIGGNGSQFQSTTTNKGNTIGINATDQAAFKGKIYFTLGRNLYVLDGKRNLTQLTHGMDVRDPTISPNGKWIAFIVRNKLYSDLVYMPVGGGPLHTVISGKGHYFTAAEGYGDGHNDYYWFAQPAWSRDSSHLLFLSDLHKNFYWGNLGSPFSDAAFLDMQVFSLPINQPTIIAAHAIINTIKPIAYADFGDGGDRDPSYRPNHPEQVVYTHYTYDSTRTKQVIQIFLEDATMMSKPHFPAYHPGVSGSGLDPAVALTPDTSDLENLQPTFSPDGNTILYIRRNDATHMSLYTMPVAENVTSDPNASATQQEALKPYNQSRQILTQQFLSQPIWSPDGTQIAYYGFANNTFDIWLATLNKDPKTQTYSLKADSVVQLTDAQGQLDGDSRPFWIA